MSFDYRDDGKIFPGLQDDRPEPPPASRARTAVWEDHPFEDEAQPEPERRAGDIGRQVVVREARPASTGGLWLALTLLLLALAGACLYGYQTLQEANIRLSQIPGMLNSMSTMDARMGNLESQLRAWTVKFQGVSGRVTNLEKTVTVNYRNARQHAEALTAQLRQQLQSEMDARNRAVDSRLGELNTAQKTAEQREALLQQQLADAQQQITALRQETSGDLAQLQQRVAGNEQQVSNLAQQVKRQRVDFELSRNQIAQVSPEISMDLTATDPRFQRFSGWVYFEPEQRYMWVRDQGVSQPVVFYDRQQARQYQVIVTSIRDTSVAGYLLLPAAPGSLPAETAGGAPSGQ